MAAITDLDNLISILSSGGTTENVFWYFNQYYSGFTSTVASANGQPNSIWLYDRIPGAGVEPTVAEICTVSTTGSLKQTNPSTGKEKYLIQHGVYSSTPGSYLLYDRLAHSQSLDGNTTSTQTVNTPALTRYSGTSSVGNIIMMENYTAVGGTPRVVEVTYTNQDGVSGRTGFSQFGNNARANAQLFTLVSGDTGVQSIQTVRLLVGGTGSAGRFGVSIIRPLSTIQVGQGNLGQVRDFTIGLPGIPKIENNACLSYLFTTNGTANSGGLIEDAYGMLTFIEV